MTSPRTSLSRDMDVSNPMRCNKKRPVAAAATVPTAWPAAVSIGTEPCEAIRKAAAKSAGQMR